MGITVKLDCSELIARLDHAQKETFNSIRNGIMTAGRSARRQALDVFARDANVVSGSAKRAVATVKNTGGGLIASWPVPSSAANLASTVNARASRAGGLLAKTFVLTGGGSADLSAKRGFIIRFGGNAIALNRTGSGHRSGYKSMFAENLKSGMGETDAAPAIVWAKTAETESIANVSTKIQRVLDGDQTAPAD